MKKIIALLFLLIILAVGGVIVGPSFIDWNKYKPEAISSIEQATGYKVEIAGNIELGIIPSPRIKIEDIKLSMPQAQGGKPLASLERIAVNVALPPLLERKIVVKSVELKKPVVNLATGADGKPLWLTPELQEKMNVASVVPAEPKQEIGNKLGEAIALDRVRITEGSFTYADGVKRTSTTLEKVDLDIKAASLKGPFDAEGSLSYREQPVKISAKTGKIEGDNKGTSLQLNLGLAGDTALIFSGVIATKPVLEVQGETTVKSANLSEALKAVTGAGNPTLAKSFSSFGFLTFKPDSIDYKDMLVSFAGNEAKGNLAVKNLKKEGDKGIQIETALSATGPVNLDSMLPPPAAGKKGFLPESLVIPSGVSVKADIKAPSLQLKGVKYGNVALIANIGGRQIDGTLKADAPGQAKIDTKYQMAFASSSKSEKGGMILADPRLSVQGTAKATNPRDFLSGFVKKETLSGAAGVLSSPLNASFDASITPHSAELKGSDIKILDTGLSVSGSLRKPKAGGRDEITAHVQAETFDADKWLAKLNEGKKPDPAADKSIAAMAAKLALPFDLKGSASFGRLILQQENYDNVSLKGSLVGKKLSLDQVSLKAEGGNAITVAGTIGDVAKLRDVDLTIDAATPDLNKAVKAFNLKNVNLPSNVGASTIEAKFNGQPEKLSFAVSAKAMKGTFDASGTLSDVMQKANVSGLVLRLKHPNYVELARIWNPAMKSSVAISKALDVQTSMNREGNLYKFSSIEASIGPATISGNASFDAGAARPKLTANLSAGELPLGDILGHEKKVKGVARAQRSGDRWSRDPIKMDWLRKYDADVNITAKMLSWQNWRLDNATIKTVVSNGTMNISQLDGKLYGGALQATSTVSAQGQGVSVSGTVSLDNVDLESFVSSFSGSQLVKAKGVVDLDTSFQTSGESQSALVSALGGKGTIAGEKLVFDGFDLARISRTMVQPSSSWRENFGSLLDSSLSGGQTAFDTLDGAFTVTRGVINLDKMQLLGASANVDIAGNVNLPLWMMDVNTTVKLAEPADAPPLKTGFKGPLDSPGKAIGKSAFDKYLGNQIQKSIEDALINKLQDKGILQKPQPAAPPAAATGAAAPPPASAQAPAEQPQQAEGDVFQQLLQQQLGGGEPPAQQVAPAPQETAPAAGETPPAAATAPVEPAPVTPEEAAEEAVRGLLNELIR